MLMSTLIVSVLSQTAFAATSISGTIYLDVAANSGWKGKKIVASFDGVVTDTVTFTGSGDILSATLPSGVSSASRMTLTAYPSDYPVDLANAAPLDKYRIITKKYNSRNYLYAWTESTDNQAWPGQTMNESGDYYYLDLSTKYDNCIFNGGKDDNKSPDLSVKYVGNVAYCDSASFADVSVTSVDISSLDANKNLFYVNDDSSVSVSKYHYNGTTIEAESKTVYLYNPSWDSAYVTYDLNDAYQVTVAMNEETSENGVKYFSYSVPKNATIKFQPRESTSITSSDLAVPDASDPMYIMDSTNYWGTLADLPTESNRIPNTFGDGIFGVTATYFDYMSDNEIDHGYLNRLSNSNYDNFSEQFNNYLNTAISDYSRTNNINNPLYFGNLYNKGAGYKGYYNYTNLPNNSNGMAGYAYAVQGLASNTLINNSLYFPSSNTSGAAKSPLFDKAWLQGENSKSEELAKIFDSYFPFKATEDSNGVTTYSFDSSGGGTAGGDGTVTGNSKDRSDNVYFTWDGATPIAVNYGYGAEYAVSDGTKNGNKDFGEGIDGTGYGVFPFNNTSKTLSSTVSDGSTRTIPANEIVCVVNDANWSTVWCHAWGGSDDRWFEAEKIDGKKYYFYKDQFPSSITGYQFTHEHKNYDYQSNDLSGLGMRYTNSNSNKWSGNPTTNTESLTVEGGTTYTRTLSNDNDYGFGIRMDMDFRVPANGMIGEATTTTISANDLFCIEDTENWGYVQCRIYNGDEGWIYPKKVDGNKYYFTRDQFNGKTVNGLLFTNNDGYGLQTSDYTNLNGLFNNYYMTGVGNKAALYRSGAASSLTITEGATPVTFEYAGDDDIWVYISDDTGHSELVLDLGGSHKFSSGKIDFSTMTSTANYVQTNYNNTTTETPAVPSTELWIRKKDSNDSEYSNLYLKTWNKVDSNGNHYDTYIAPYGTAAYTYKDGTTDVYFKYRITDLGGAREFTINSAQTTESQIAGLNMSNATVPGSAFYIRHRAGHETDAQLYTHTNNNSSITYPATHATSSFFGGQHLDPSKTYHMTVFYMERGMIESNLKVSFSMTPVSNNLLVDKAVEIPKINNTELEKAVRENDKFIYNSSNSDNQRSMQGVEYTYTQQSGESTLMQIEDEQGVFTLKDNESASFVSQFTTGSKMTVVESAILKNDDENLNLAERYDTKWNLYGASAEQPASGNGTKAEFDLVGNNPDRNAELELSYTNTLKTGGIKLSKEVKNKQETVLTDCNVDFTYQVKLDLRGGTNYTAYPLNYTVTTNDVSKSYYSSDGTISFSPQSVVEIKDLPACAKFIISEKVPEGYACSNNNYVGVIPIDNVIAYTFKNVQSEGNGEITVHKTLDGSNYTGSQFSFTLEGLASAGDGYIDMSGKTYTANSVNNGAVTFKLNFTQVGKYRFKVTENPVDSALLGYIGDTKTYYIQVMVNENASNELEITETKYYSDSAFTTEAEGGITFANTTQKAQIDINKKNASGNTTGVAGTKFLLIRVNDTVNVTRENVVAIMNNSTLKNAVVAKDGAIGDEGNLTFADLNVYQEKDKLMYNGTTTAVEGADYLSGTSHPQRYCVVEYQPTSGYHLNATPYYVTFPIKAAEGETLKTGYYRDSNGYVRKGNSAAQNPNDPYVFSQTFDYVNYPLVVPEASGNGAGAWFTAGMITISVAGALTLAYFSCLHINRKRRKARVNSRKN